MIINLMKLRIESRVCRVICAVHLSRIFVM